MVFKLFYKGQGALMLMDLLQIPHQIRILLGLIQCVHKPVLLILPEAAVRPQPVVLVRLHTMQSRVVCQSGFCTASQTDKICHPWARPGAPVLSATGRAFCPVGISDAGSMGVGRPSVCDR